ncbi:MAG: hypothetical protein H6873_04550 [Hyphomicrobiaceae bacterium]|nr:hypothetical protein [Hyphomicrobiaceae bacterium]
MKNSPIFALLRFLPHFFFRTNLALHTYLGLVIVSSVLMIASFLLLFSGIRAQIAHETVIHFRFFVEQEMDVPWAMQLGLSALALTGLGSIAESILGGRVSADFGLEVFSKPSGKWKELDPGSRRAVFNVSKLGSNMAGILLRSVQPLGVLFAGTIYLLFISPIVAIGLVLLNVVAIFLYVPARMPVHQTKYTYRDLLNKMVIGERENSIVHSILLSKSGIFVMRRMLRASNLLILFFVFFGAYLYYGAGQVSGVIDSHLLVVVMIVRSSLMSMTRVTFGVSVAGRSVDELNDLIALLRFGTIPRATESPMGSDDLDEDDF